MFTTFPVNENPLSEGGFWKQNNTNRATVQTIGGNAFGTGTNNDGYAYAAGFGDSVLETTVFRDAALSDTEPNSYEVEHLHRLTDTAGTTSCYELDFAFSGGDPIIVLWSGAASFVVLSGLVKDANFWPDGAGGQLRNGYKIKSETVLLPSPRINFYCDSGSGYVLYGHYIFGADAVNDAVPLATGDPAIAFFTTIGSSNLLGFQDATVTPVAASAFPAVQPTRAGRGPGKGPRMRRMAPQRFPVEPPPVIETTQRAGPPFRPRGIMGPARRRQLPQRFPDTAASVTILVSTIGAWNWAGVPSNLTKILTEGVGAYTWLGTISNVPRLVKAVPGAWIWAGTASPISKSLNATKGVYTWSGTGSKIAASIASRSGAYTWAGVAATLTSPTTVNATPGAYTWAGKAASFATLVQEGIGRWTWNGTHSNVTVPGAASTTNYYPIPGRRTRR